MNSNQSRPVPPANTGSKLLDVIADTSLKLIHFERRFDPFFRPAFDAVLRDPLARFVTWLINLQRVDEKLALAEENPPTPISQSSRYCCWRQKCCRAGLTPVGWRRAAS